MAERCAVAIGDVDLEGAEETARLIKAEGGVCLVRRTDVTRADDVRGLIDETVNTFGRLDYAVNNAAIEGARIGDHAAEARRLSIALQKSK
jgi:NAD(P)-dependent dehydrogenase (short-subunit alcohol dehydrogenase family)